MFSLLAVRFLMVIAGLILGIAVINQWVNYEYLRGLQEGVVVSPCQVGQIRPLAFPADHHCFFEYTLKDEVCWYHGESSDFSYWTRYPHTNVTGGMCPVTKFYLPPDFATIWAAAVFITICAIVLNFSYGQAQWGKWENEGLRLGYFFWTWMFCLGIFLVQSLLIGFQGDDIPIPHWQVNLFIPWNFNLFCYICQLLLYACGWYYGLYQLRFVIELEKNYESMSIVS